MRGYLSFLVVFVSLIIIFSLIQLSIAVNNSDFSKSIVISRTYSLQMNAKELILESARLGATDGFFVYDSSHDIKNCGHCPDAGCSPDPRAPNRCDTRMCDSCFRESDARKEAENYATAQLDSLKSYTFDPDFYVSISIPVVQAFTKFDPLAKNSHSLDYIRFVGDVRIAIESEKFDISAKAHIPKGMVIR
ncbi:hypothetical protein KKF81_04545 [Candidatus Micrarchaeota archaeon]|nr:hypothetical protein [Candidatus Micrarchaeota archaeon]MBU1166195.1 hypothetical protein [Candidatus Micrarchaeota archaeon]MBU1887126.1 hypothetical protein [Candidatus Micrarchaeota archaeon]